MRKLAAIVFVLCLLGAAGMAQVPIPGNVFFGYSLNHGTVGPGTSTGTLNGWEASFEGRMFPHIGLVADVSQQYGTLDVLGIPADETTTAVLFGPRLSFRVSRFRPYVHALIGVGHVHEINDALLLEDSDTSFADALGGGVDYRLISHVDWRVQLDSLTTNFFGDWQHNTRFSTGLAVHF